MDKKIPVKTLYMLSLISFGLIALGLGSTYAIFTASAEINNPISIVSNLAYNSDVIETADVIVPAGEIVSTSLNISNTSSNLLNYITWYSTSSSDIYAGVKISSGSSNPTGTITSNAEPIQVIVQLKNASTSSKLVTIGISGSTDSVVKDSLMTEVPNREIYYLTDYVNNLYTNNSKSSVTNNNISYNYINLYDTDTDDTTSGGLINDRLGSDSIDVNSGNIRYYGANPNNYVDIGEIYKEDLIIKNYEKFSPYYNFDTSSECLAEFNCSTKYSDYGYSDATVCEANLHSSLNQLLGTNFSSVAEACAEINISKGTPILYRIIGLFKDIEKTDGNIYDAIKIRSNISIGTFSWDTSSSSINEGNGVSEWSQADLMKLLNSGYSSNQDLDVVGNTTLINNSLWWNSKNGACYNSTKNSTTTCDFTIAGLSNQVKNKIADIVWNTAGLTSYNIYSNEAYLTERSDNTEIEPSDGIERKITWDGSVALIYASDFGYSTDFNNCNSNLHNYDNECNNYSWLTDESWILSTVTNTNPSSMGNYIDKGRLHYSILADARNIHPTFYLNSNIAVLSGTGTETDPYVIR